MPEPATCPRCRHGIDGRSPHPPECARCPEGYCTAVPDDRVAATLAGIRGRSAAALEFPMSGFAEDSIRCCTQSALDVPRLLEALEAARKLTVRWKNFAASGEECADELREAITTALTGTGRAQPEEDGNHDRA
jgi:hypothetical protein